MWLANTPAARVNRTVEGVRLTTPAAAAYLIGASILFIGATSCDRRSDEPPPPLTSTPREASDRVYLTGPQRQQAAKARLFPASVASLLNVRQPLRFGEYRWDARGVPPARAWVFVDLRKQLISVFMGPNEIGTAVILYGATARQTPVGTFPVVAKLRDHRSATYDNAPMPYTLRLTSDGVSIHGSDVRDGYATHGCIGVPTAFAAKLFSVVEKGDPVTIVEG